MFQQNSKLVSISAIEPGTGCLRNYRKSVLSLRISVLGRFLDLKYIFAVIYGTPSSMILRNSKNKHTVQN